MNMDIQASQVQNSTLCFSLRGTAEGGRCPTLAQLANPITRRAGVLEVGLYDRKADGYECCPVSPSARLHAVERVGRANGVGWRVNGRGRGRAEGEQSTSKASWW